MRRTPRSVTARKEAVMDVIYPRCAGLDIHKKNVVACVIISESGGLPQKEIQTFSTMTDDLLKLSAWLTSKAVTHVAMESTGVYWQPIWNLLEGNFELLLVNAQHIKAVPGRKTDVRDCEWIADLLRHGLLKGSFVPDREQRELRELTRYRTALIQERTAEVNRLQKTLEGANIKLASVASDVLGRSGREMLEALVAGTTDAAALADLAKGKLRQKLPDLERALTGQFRPHQQFLVAQHLARIDDLDAAIAQLDTKIAEQLRPFAEAIARLDAIPGVGERTAQVIVAEVGSDMRRFPTAGHLASWAGMAPGNHTSAGKRLSGKTRKGNRYLRSALVEAAQAAARKKDSYLSAHFHRLAARRGYKKAVIAAGHTILVIAYHLLAHPNSIYQDLGLHYYDQRDRDRVQRQLVRRLEALGYQVALEPAVA
jgi:transposase